MIGPPVLVRPALFRRREDAVRMQCSGCERFTARLYRYGHPDEGQPMVSTFPRVRWFPGLFCSMRCWREYGTDHCEACGCVLDGVRMEDQREGDTLCTGCWTTREAEREQEAAERAVESRMEAEWLGK